MKALALALAATALLASNSALACSITPKGDSQIRVNALHKTLGNDEQLVGLRHLGEMDFEITVTNYSSDATVTRAYRLINQSPMCPDYKAVELN